MMPPNRPTKNKADQEEGLSRLLEALVIKNKRLEVEIHRPGSVYRNSRFDWSSFVTQVTLDGVHTFCGAENASGKDGGLGLCCEFGHAAALGYDEAVPGELFVKPGVGALTRPDWNPYNFLSPYSVNPFDVTENVSADEVSFSFAPRPCNGYALGLTRRLSIALNHLDMHVTLHNCGDKAVVTDEYCHNFIRIDGHNTGPELVLTTAFDFVHPNVNGILNTQGNVTRCTRVPRAPFYAPSPSTPNLPGVYWVLKHEPSGVGLAESGSFGLSRFALWGHAHVVSPEAFNAVILEPGQSQRWHRRFTFFKPGDIEPRVSAGR